MAFPISVLRIMSDITKPYDAVIIGAGLTGSAAAIHLVSAGKSVCLIEKTKAAHHKVCGEFLSHEAVAYLDALGLDVNTLGAVPITKMRLVKGAHIAQSSLPFQAYSVSRYVLDETLINLAIKAGVKVERGVTITDISNDNGWHVSGGHFTAHGKALFLATGKHDVKGWQRPEGVKNDYIGLKMHYQMDDNTISNSTEVVMFHGGYAGLQPIENGRANLCLVIEKQRFKTLGSNWKSLVKMLMQDTPYLKTILSNAKPLWDKPLAIYGIPYGFVHMPEQNTPQNLYRLGDQMAVIPSFAGGGMAIALYTAKCAVDSYLNNTDYNPADLKYHIQKSTWLGRMMASNIGQTILMMLARLYPKLLTKTAHYTRLKR
jgi:flavin-dependent dehydrogenase